MSAYVSTMVQRQNMSGHYCRSDRLTVSTVAATVLVAATVTVYLVKATATATAMDTQMTYRNKKTVGAAATSPPDGEGRSGRGGRRSRTEISHTFSSWCLTLTSSCDLNRF